MRGNDLREEFSPYGEIIFARVNLDRETKRSKGFWFVEFANAEDAAKAKAEMDWKEVRGRAIKVDFAKEDPTKMYNKAERSETSEKTETTDEWEIGDETDDLDDETVVDENAF